MKRRTKDAWLESIKNDLKRCKLTEDFASNACNGERQFMQSTPFKYDIII